MRAFKTILMISVLMVILISCNQIPVAPTNIPEDPVGTSMPSSWGNDISMSVSIDKTGDFLPIGARDFKKLKVSFIGHEVPSDITEENFRVFEDGKEQGITLSSESEVSKNIDIVFIVDVTGSMGEEINGVKNSIINFLDYLKDSGLNVKIAVIPFDDFAPATRTYEDERFSDMWLDLSDEETAHDFVSQLYASGGGDWPENPYGAIYFAWNNVSWRAGSQRIFILLTDANAHYRDDGSYNEFQPQVTKSEILSMLVGYAALHIVASVDYYYSEDDTDFSGPDDPREIAMQTGGFIIYQNGGEEVDLSEIGIGEAILNSVLIYFESDSPVGTHTINVFYESPEGEQGSASLQLYY